MANATITAAVAEKTVQENNDAIVRFNLSSALTSSTTVKVSVNPQGGATTADYGTPPGALFYHMGILPGGWLSVPNDGVITINAGFTEFELKTNITNDTITEGYDSLAFTVAQTASSVGIADSWWVPSLVKMLDAQGTGAAATPRSISAGAPVVPGVEGAAWAEAPFTLSGAGPDYAGTEVRVSMYGLGGATAADYTTGILQVKLAGAASFSPVSGGVITIPGSIGSFSLGMAIQTDSLTEATEGIAFNVAQTTSSVGLVDSWWVQNTVDIKDAPGTGYVALPRSITASATTPAVEGSTAATATFTLPGGAGYATTEVRVSMYGLGGATAADYTGSFGYRIGGVEKGAVPGTGLITLNSNDTTFELYRAIVTDSLSEASEGIAFNVAQTTSSIGLVDSWWVQSTVDLQDARGAGTMAQPRTITANTSTTPGIEGSTPATATFTVTRVGASTDPLDYATTQVKVSMYGLGGATAADYNGVFSYKIGTVDTSVPPTGLITINSTDTSFQLYMAIKGDTIAETGEGIAFNVAQTTSSIGLVDSWFVQSIVDLADATSIYTTVTGAIGPDNFTANATKSDMFVIPGIGVAHKPSTSTAKADGATGLYGGTGGYPEFISGQSFDTITGFAAGIDRIALPTAVSGVFTNLGVSASEETLITNLQATSPGGVGFSTAGYFTVAAFANILYLLVDTSSDGLWVAADDTFIKLMGTTGALSAADFVLI
jgi:hypothetical protein